MTGPAPDGRGPVSGEAELSAYAERVVAFAVRAAPSTHSSEQRAGQLLADGCGLALRLEARCARLERTIAELASVADDRSVAQRLRTLLPQLGAAQRQLTEIRALIAEVRAHGAVRSARTAI